jgi:NitT/TauT family transport system permease protein
MEAERVVIPAELNRELSSSSTTTHLEESAQTGTARLKDFTGDSWKYLQLIPQKSAVMILLLAIWEILPRLGLIDPVFLPSFSTVINSLAELTTSGELWRHTWISFERAFSGFALATLLAVPLGFLVGWYKPVERYLDPTLQAFRQLPTLALFPVFILIFGIGEVSKIAIITKASFWPVFLNTVSGVAQLDPLLVKCARSMGVSKFGMFRRIVLPASIPSMFSGLRLSATTALLMLVAAEMLGAESGIGFLIFNCEARFMIPEMYAAILALTVYGIVLNYVLIAVQKRVSRWKEEIVHH